MKKLFIIVSVIMLPTSCLAMDAVTKKDEISKLCDELSKKSGINYSYGEGILESISIYIPPTCAMPVPEKVTTAKRCIDRINRTTFVLRNANPDINPVIFNYPEQSRPDILLFPEHDIKYGFCFTALSKKNGVAEGEVSSLYKYKKLKE